ncbi:MAG: V-type ATP synthase subunit E family protein [Candidatus Krumholzibacteriaceae bacterium]|jgi:vacuolar-type H+-ATPase subunit E/Vma4
MESVDKICARIRGDGAKEIDEILEKARQSAAGIVAKAEAEATTAGERIVREAADKAELAKKRSLSSVSLEVKRIHLRSREEVVTAVMERVKAEIDGSRKRSDYAAVLAGLVAEALRVLEGEEFVVSADRRDLAVLESGVFPAVRERMRKEGRAVKSIEGKELAAPTAGGVQIGVPGGKVVYDNTFEARTYRYRDDIRAIIFKSAFSTEDKVE